MENYMIFFFKIKIKKNNPNKMIWDFIYIFRLKLMYK